MSQKINPIMAQIIAPLLTHYNDPKTVEVHIMKAGLTLPHPRPLETVFPKEHHGVKGEVSARNLDEENHIEDERLNLSK